MNGSSVFGKIVGLFVAVTPFVVSNRLFSGSINAKYFFIVGALTVAFLYLAYLLIHGRHTLLLRGRWLLGLLGLVLALHYVSAFAGVFPGASLMSDILRSTGVVFLTYMVLFAVLLSELMHERDWAFLRRALIFSASVFAFLSFFGNEGAGLTGRFLTVNFETPGLSIGNTTFAGAFLVLAFIVTLIEIARTTDTKWRRIFVGLGLVQLFSPLLLSFGIWTADVSLANPATLLGDARSSSATAWGLVVFLLGLWSLRRYVTQSKRALVSYIYSAVWLLAIFVAVGLLFTPGSTVQEKYIEVSTEARVLVWGDSIAPIKERPVFGWGPENFRLAHDSNIDDRLYLNRNIGEIWFDRAHNIIVDTLVSVGVVGALALLVFAAYFVAVVHRAYKKKVIGYAEAAILAAFPVAHFLQLQTAFDTIITYLVLAVLLGYVLWLERKLVVAGQKQEASTRALQKKKSGAGILLAFTLVAGTLVAGWFVLIEEYGRQKALFSLFLPIQQTVGETVENINQALDGTTSFETLRLSSSSFIKGLLGAIAQEDLTSEQRSTLVASGMRQMEVYEDYYQKWLLRVPSDYRARMNYAYLLLVRTALGDDRLDDAEALVEGAYELAPDNPLTYAMDGAVQLYRGDLDEARAKFEAALAINPDALFTRNMLSYFEEQVAQFPRITVLKLENL